MENTNEEKIDRGKPTTVHVLKHSIIKSKRGKIETILSNITLVLYGVLRR